MSPYRTAGDPSSEETTSKTSIARLRRLAYVRGFIRNLIPLELYSFFAKYFYYCSRPFAWLFTFPYGAIFWLLSAFYKTVDRKRLREISAKQTPAIIRRHPLLRHNLEMLQHVENRPASRYGYVWRGHFGIFPETEELIYRLEDFWLWVSVVITLACAVVALVFAICVHFALGDHANLAKP